MIVPILVILAESLKTKDIDILDGSDAPNRKNKNFKYKIILTKKENLLQNKLEIQYAGNLTYHP